jgi:hypothetical protein
MPPLAASQPEASPRTGQAFPAGSRQRAPKTFLLVRQSEWLDQNQCRRIAGGEIIQRRRIGVRPIAFVDNGVEKVSPRT